MGEWYENNKTRLFESELLDKSKVTLGEIWEQERRQQKTEEKEHLQNALADAKAVWALADYSIPADVKESAERWKMNETLLELWRGAFIEGWRAAYKARRL